MLINIILWLVLGAAAGWIASLIMKRDSQMGAVANVVVGIVGAIIGGWLVSLFGVSVDTFSIPGLLTAIVGAVALLGVVGAVQTAV